MESDHPNVVLCPDEGLLTTKSFDKSLTSDFTYQSKVVKSLR